MNTGNDNNAGTSTTTALKTMTAAMQKTAPGDVVNVMAGIYNYTNQNIGITGTCLWISPNYSGAPGNPITYRVNPGDEGQVIIQNYEGWGAIIVNGADHIIIDGFKIVGQVAFYSHADLEAEYYGLKASGLHTGRNAGPGMAIQAEWNATPINPAVNVIVRNCEISQTTGGGISLYEAAKVILENNTIYSTSRYGKNGGSGISSIFTQDCQAGNPNTPCASFDNPADDAYNLIFRGNRIFDNDNLYPCSCLGYTSITDGNGIILDINNRGNNNHLGRTLVENNVIYNNGGKGIHAYYSHNIDIINNTLYNNATRPNLGGACDISVYDSDNTKIYNNTVKSVGNNSSVPSMRFTSANNVDVRNNVHSRNISSNGSYNSGNNLQQDPLYVNEGSFDLHLSQTSPAIDHGNSNYPIATIDHDGNNRIGGNSVDAGAYETNASPNCPISAGTSASITACQTTSPIDLFTKLGGSPTPGGSWTDDNNSGGLNGSIFNPLGVIGVFEFTYIVIDGLCTKTATVTVSVSNCTANPICNTATAPIIDGDAEAPVWAAQSTTIPSNLLVQKEECSGSGPSLDVWDTAWEMPLRVASMAHVNTYFDHLLAKGYKGAIVSYLNHWQGGINETNYNGDLAATWDGSNLSLNAAHADLFEDFLDAAHARGLKIGVVAAWGVYYATNQYNSPIYVTPNNSYAWGQQLGNRFGNHPALDLWVMGGDNYYGQFPEPCAVWANMAAGIKAGGSTTPRIGYHTAATNDRRLHCINDAWNEIQLPQTGHCQTANPTQIQLTTVSNATTKEVWAGELRYEDITPQWCSPQVPSGGAAVLADVQAAVAANMDAILYGHTERFQWGHGDAGSTGQGFVGVQASFNDDGETAMFNYLSNGTVCTPIVPTMNDLSIAYQLTWDNTNLYIHIEVTDSALVNNSDADIWEDDGIELYLDGGNEKATSYDVNDHQFVFRYNDNTIYHLSAGATNPVGVTAAQGTIPGGYTKEIAVAWSLLGVTPTNGTQIGLDIHVNDDDDGGARDQKVATFATTDNAWQDPSIFGTYELSANCVACLPAGTSCDDNDPNTTNDQEDGNCNCIGTPIVTGIAVCEANTPPSIDGLGKDWNQTRHTLNNNVNGTIASPADLSGEFQVSWDNDYLYIFGQVKDDVLINDSQAEPYEDDLFEVYIDGGNEKATSYDVNDHQLMFRVQDQVVHYWSAQLTDPAGVDFTRVIVPGGYDIEIRIDWNFIGTTPSHAKDIGLDIHLVDDDDGGTKDKKLTWHATIDEAWNNPSLFNTVALSNQCNLGRMVHCLPSLLLEGPYKSNTGLMSMNLLQAGLLPAGHPYTGAPWNYNGSEGAGWSTTDYPVKSVDWVLVSLRTSLLADDEFARFAGVLLEDGTVHQISPITISQNITEAYIVVEHRNHLPAMSPSSINIVNDTIRYDFRLGDSYSGQNGFGQKQIGSNWLLFAGNVDQSNPSGYEITGSDKIIWTAMNGNFGVYDSADFNLDSDISGMDRILWNYNNGISSGIQK